MKDIITITLDNGDKKDMELVAHYSEDKNYILYKPIDGGELYLASYHYDDGKFIIDTDLTKDEINKLTIIFQNYLKGEVLND